jgi:hypothetical protein
MKKIQQLIILFLISGTAILTSSYRDLEDDWTLVSSSSGIEVYAKPFSCSSQSWLAIKFANTTDQVQLFKYEVSEPANPTHSGIKGELSLKSNEMAIGSCESLWSLTLPFQQDQKLSIQERLSISVITNLNTK